MAISRRCIPTRCGAHLPRQPEDQKGFWRHEQHPLRCGLAEPVPVRRHAAFDDHCGQSGLCGGLRAGFRPFAMNGDISFGVIVAFILYVRLFTSPFEYPGSGHDSDADRCGRRGPYL